MAFTLTTLSAAVALNDTSILVASITSLAAGNLIAVDKEIMRCVAVPNALTRTLPRPDVDLVLASLDERPLDAILAALAATPARA